MLVCADVGLPIPNDPRRVDLTITPGISAVTEVLRGCIRGCRFCQAGYIYRPYRERSVDVINRQAYDLCHNCGYDEVSLSSLSTSDHSHLADLMEKMLVWAEPEHVDLSLPSLRECL